MMLAPLRTLAEPTVVFSRLMMIMIIGICKVSGVIVIVVGAVVITVAGIIACATG